MALIKSISGIRGTIGGRPGEGLTPIDVVKFTTAYSAFICKRSGKENPAIVVGRDARISGEMVQALVEGTLMGCGMKVFDIGLSTTPTVEIAVTELKADGGIILTASHNPAEWNALKLLNEKGEFLSAAEGEEILRLADRSDYEYTGVYQLGSYEQKDALISRHIEMILALPLVDTEAIRRAGFRVAIDCVNSSGSIALPELLEKLGVKKVDEIFCEPNGDFPHNPEPLPENLTELSETVVSNKADLGFTVDPDVDRLAIINEDGSMFGEEYTLVAVADYVLQNTPGNTVSNMSSTMALKDVTEKHGGNYSASAVGEVNVVEMMKETNAVIGGEGNGGVIYPELHYGRDALVGIALFLSHLAKSGKKCSELRASYPAYFISKNKIQLKADTDVDDILEKIKSKYRDEEISTIDGLKIVFGKEWVHLRKSNTEPIIRIYSESRSEEAAKNLSNRLIAEIESLM